MEFFCINRPLLSYTLRMEKDEANKIVPTKEKQEGVYLSLKDAEEYKLYKRNKRLKEISLAISSSESIVSKNDDIQKVCENATRLKQVSVRVPSTKLSQVFYYLTGGKVKMDCIVGGNGETLAKVKAYEARLAVKKHAKEITLVLTPSHLDSCRYGEIKKEIKKVRRAIGKAILKVRVESSVSMVNLSRVARIARECGVSYFSVPYFQGCQLLKADLGMCGLEVSDVEDMALFRKLKGFGVDRIVTKHAPLFYSEWLKEVEEESEKIGKTEPVIKQEEQESTTPTVPSDFSATKTKTSRFATEYGCRLEGSDLKFL